MMTEAEFQEKYHGYHTADLETATVDAIQANRDMGLTGSDTVVPVALPFSGGTRYCLMLQRAVTALMVAGLIPFQSHLPEFRQRLEATTHDE